jgi:alkanesulfonate monooxygenase SsuD/methylene tetrahydromethanopterin reductase-like flavin-dependent oxidoreductase (luciferase family)
LHGKRWLPRWSELRDIARIAEQVGFDTLFVPDHLIMRSSAYWGFEDGESRGTWEAWTTLAALAEATTTIGLGSYVLANSFRQPSLVAKMAATLDEISDGRLVLGLGTGSHMPEYSAFGYPTDHLATRFDEALQIIVPLLREGHVDFVGKYYAARDCELLPRGPRSQGPRIWIAGFGPRVMRLAARWADAFNTSWHTDPHSVREPFDRLTDACRAEDRDPATLQRTIGTFVSFAEEQSSSARTAGALRGSAADIASRLLEFKSAGVEHVTCMLQPPDVAGVERFANVIAGLAAAQG